MYRNNGDYRQRNIKMPAAPTPEFIRSTALDVLAGIAPEADLASLEPDRSFHEQLDIDSMDFINFVTALGRTTGITVAEEDYYKLATLNGCIRYFSEHSPA